MRYKTPEGFRRALEDRFKGAAAGSEAVLMRLRKIAAFERLLARLQADGDRRWILKGGVVLLLRFGSKARTTMDLDLGAIPSPGGGAAPAEAEILARLIESSARNLNDGFRFEVVAERELPVEAGTSRAFRFRVHALLGGRTFERFRTDVGVGDTPAVDPVDLPATDLLDFAELPRLTFRAVAPEQHFAEKMHALTRPWGDRINTRVRDLVDLMLLLDAGLGEAGLVRKAVGATFAGRTTHGIPSELADPPPIWNERYAAMAAESSLRETTVPQAMARLRDYWKGLQWPNA